MDDNVGAGPSRCFPFWQEMLACYVMSSDSTDATAVKQCVPALEDYYECLHHKKEVRFTCSRGIEQHTRLLSM